VGADADDLKADQPARAFVFGDGSPVFLSEVDAIGAGVEGDFDVVVDDDGDGRVGCGYDENWLKSKLPLTYAYLLKFEKLLRQRSGFRKYFSDERGKPFAPFYSLYNIGDYTLIPHKVCWREQAEFFTCSVTSNAKLNGKSKIVIPDHKLMFVPLLDKNEAHYVCAMLNSSTAVLIVKSYGVETQTSTHVLEYVRLPKYDAADNRHQRLAELSVEVHALATEPTEANVKTLQEKESEIDEKAAEVWDITATELRDIQSSLADLR
jgi:hypothetical protein